MPASRNAETELALIERAQEGDRDAFEELVRQHYTFIVNIVYRMCNDTTLAEDAAQEAFLRAWLKLPSYHPDSALRNWLCRIAINAALDVLRHRKKEEPMEEATLHVIPDRAPGPETAYMQKEQALFLQRLLQDLPEGARSVIILREYGQLSYQEIALVLDIPIGTVMSRLNFARSRLREWLQAEPAQMEPDYA